MHQPLLAHQLLTINQAALTGSIANQSKIYGANDPFIWHQCYFKWHY